jgi:hypothetical protein
MITCSPEFNESYEKGGIEACAEGWYIEVREGQKVLCTVPPGSVVLELVRTGNRWYIAEPVKAPIMNTGVPDNFIMRNRSHDKWTIQAAAGTHMHNEMILENAKIHSGETFSLDTLEITDMRNIL